MRDNSGRGVSGAKVVLERRGANSPATTVTDAQGWYHFAAANSGDYTLQVSAPGGEAFAGPFPVADREVKRVDLVLAKPSASSVKSTAAAPEFYDEPSFTVAGVTDSTNLGGHGSNVVAQTKVALAKDVASLGKEPSKASAPSSGAGERASPATEASLRQSAERTRAQLARPDLSQSQKAELHHLLGDTEEQLGDPVAAVHEYQLAAEMEPSEPNLFDWGAELLLHHAPEPAVEVFTKGNHLFPRSMRILAGLGTAFYAQGSLEQAAQRLREASDLRPDDPTPYMFFGILESADTTHSGAFKAMLQRFAKRQPDNAMANYYYGLALCKGSSGQGEDKERAEAESLLEKAVRLDPGLAAAYLQLGILHADRGDYPGAIPLYQKAIAAKADLEEAHYRLARAYSMNGQQPEAQHETQVYKELATRNAEEIDRERHQIQQFVYTLRGGAAGKQAQ